MLSQLAKPMGVSMLLSLFLMGPLLRRSAGLDPSDASRERFRVWFGRRIEELLVPRSEEPSERKGILP